MNDILKRIEYLRITNEAKASHICEYLGVNKSTYSTWRTNDRVPEAKYIPKIAEFFNTTTDYILTGRTVTNIKMPVIVDIYDSLSEEGQQMLLQRADELKRLGYIKSNSTGVVSA